MACSMLGAPARVKSPPSCSCGMIFCTKEPASQVRAEPGLRSLQRASLPRAKRPATQLLRRMHAQARSTRRCPPRCQQRPLSYLVANSHCSTPKELPDDFEPKCLVCSEPLSAQTSMAFFAEAKVVAPMGFEAGSKQKHLLTSFHIA